MILFTISVEVILTAIDKADYDEVSPLFEVLDVYLAMKDALSERRTASILADSENCLFKILDKYRYVYALYYYYYYYY